MIGSNFDHDDDLRHLFLEKQEKLAHWFKKNGIGDSYKCASVACVDNEKFVGFVSRYDVLRDSQGLLLWGTVGTGKTYALFALVNHFAGFLTDSGYQIGSALKYITALNFTVLAKNWDHESEVEKLLAARFLILDDLGAEPTNEYSLSCLSRLIEARSTNLLPTFISTNLDPQSIKARYGERVLSRLIRMCAVIEFSGPDRRLLEAERLDETFWARDPKPVF